MLYEREPHHLPEVVAVVLVFAAGDVGDLYPHALDRVVVAGGGDHVGVAAALARVHDVAVEVLAAGILPERNKSKR